MARAATVEGIDAVSSLSLGERMVRSRPALIRHAVIWLFIVIILLPLAWVLLMSIKSLPDAMQGAIWPTRFDFTHYGYVLATFVSLLAWRSRSMDEPRWQRLCASHAAEIWLIKAQLEAAEP